MKQQSLFFVVFCLVGLAASLSPAADLVISVEAGKQRRVNTPVRVLFSVAADQTDATTASLVDAAGNTLAGQVTKPGLLAAAEAESKGESVRQLHFILPELVAGKKARFEVTLGKAASQGPAYSWSDTAGQYSELRWGKTPVLKYMYARLDDSTKENRDLTYKVFHHLYDPTGSRLVTKGPGGLYPHHRGLYYGFNRCTYDGNKRADTWHCQRDDHQSHEGLVSSEAGPVVGRHRVKVDWHGSKKATFANELREMSVYRVPGGQLVEFASRLKSAGGKVKLDGDPQHAGFQFRADNEVAAKTKRETVYLNVDGKGKPGKTRNWPGDKTQKNLPWKAVLFTLGDQRYSLAYLDREENPKPAMFSEREYGRTGSYFVYELTDDNVLDVNYRVWLQEGEIDAEQIAALQADFEHPCRVEVLKK